MKKIMYLILTSQLAVWALPKAFTQTVSLDTVQANPGDTVWVPCKFTNMNNIGAITLFILFDESVLTFQGSDNLVPEAQGLLANGMTNPARVGLSWVAPGSTGVNFTDGQVFDLKFLYAGETSELTFSQECEIVDWDGNPLAIVYVNGMVKANTGSANSSWNGAGNWSDAASWSNGVPGAETDAVIQSGGVTVNAGAVCKNLHIQTGTTLTVAPGNSLTVVNNLVVEGSFLIASDASGTGSFINSGTIAVSGTSKTERHLSGNGSLSHLVSSPVLNATSNVFANSVVTRYNEPTQAWIQVGAGELLGKGAGYAVVVPASQTVEFDGPVNTGDISCTNLSYSSLAGQWPNGLNLVGNPYPSALDWDMGDWIKTGINASVYAWNGTQYISWNGFTGSLQNGIIPAMQGFLVSSHSPAAGLTIPNNSRIHSNQPFLKEGMDINNLLVLKAEGNNMEDHTYINFNQESTNGFDQAFDAYKLAGVNDAPQLFTMAGNVKLSIHVMPSKAYTDTVVVLGFKAGMAGNYKIIAETIQNFSSDIPIYLEDLKTGDTLNLRTDSVYSFYADPADDELRFDLRFKTPPSGLPDITHDKIRIYASGSDILADASAVYEAGMIEIYDLTGRLEAKTRLSPGMINRVRLNSARGLFVVRLTTGSVSICTKVFLGQ